MSPQFVDYDADGHIDIVAGTFAGSPYVARGSAEGFHQPEMIRDKDGERIVLNQFWNYETKKWDETSRCDPEGGAPIRGHGTSAIVMDWDGDGDFDLLLGDYDGGYLYLRANEGKAGTPAFGKQNVLVRVGKKPIKVDKMATMRVFDFNGDGTQDLLLGSMGDTYRDQAGGGVFAYANSSENLPPKFGKPITWIKPSPKGHTAPVRPDAGLYVDIADHEGDGDLDLIVGGYSMWTPPKPKLSAAQEDKKAELEADRKTLMNKSRDLNGALLEASRLPESERDAAIAKVRKAQAKVRAELSKALRSVNSQLEPLTAGAKRKSYVWLYENLTIQSTTPAPGDQR